MTINSDASKLKIGISTRALFNLEEEDKIFKNEGVDAYCKYQRERENDLIKKGAGYNVIERLLNLNKLTDKNVVEVVLLSRNSPDLSLRAFNSIQEYNLDIKTGSFTSGRPIGPYVGAWELDLFLSNEREDVKMAFASNCAAAKLGSLPNTDNVKIDNDEEKNEVRIAFDGDSVVFSEESENIFQEKGLKAFLEHETNNANTPMKDGPFGNFLRKLAGLRLLVTDEKKISPIRISIVTARNAPSHERVIKTLRAWGTPADEAHFVGNWDKGKILKASNPHIFFDDQVQHILSASQSVTAGHVPSSRSDNSSIIPAG